MRKKNRLVSPAVPAVPAAPVPVWLIPLAILSLLWAAFVVLRFDEKFPASWNALLQGLDGFSIPRWGDFFATQAHHAKSLLLIALVDTAAAGWGSRLLPNDEKTSLRPLERFILSLGLGMAVLSTMLFLLGVVGLYGRSILWMFYAIFCAGGFVIGRPLLRDCASALRSFSWSDLFASPLNWFALMLAGVALMMALVPELFYDSLVYHVGLPQMYVNEGRLLNTPNVYFSRFPMFMHMLYVLGLGLDGSALAKLFNSTMMLTGLGAIVSVCRRLQWQRAAVWACLLVLAMPVFQLNVWSTAVDASMGTYSMLAFLAFLIWRGAERPAWHWFTVFSALTGAVFSIKYTGVVMVLSFGVLLLTSKSNGESAARLALRLVVFGAMVTLMMSPWLIRNFIFTGNPVCPIAVHVIPTRDTNIVKITPEEELVKRSVPRSVGAFFEFPWTQTMLEATNFNFIGPMTLACLPLLLLIPFRQVRGDPALVILTVAYFLIALRFSGDIRYLLPGFFLVGILLAGGVASLTQQKKVVGWIVQTGFTFVVLYQLCWIFQCAQGLYKPGPVLTGAQSYDDYVSTMHDGLNICPWNSLTKELEALPDSTRVYVFGTEQVFGFPKRFWYSSCHDDTPLVMWSNASTTPEELLKKMTDQKFTHLLIDAPEAVRLKGYSPFEWTDHGRQVFVQFAQKYLDLMDVKPIAQFPQALFLYEIKPNPAQPQKGFEEFFKSVLNL